MDNDNPYKAPQEFSRADPGPEAFAPYEPLTLSDALRFELKTAALFAVVGGVLGLAIGIIMPNYYREVFNAFGDPDFKPSLAGMLLGFMQGGLLGVFAGIALLTIVVWSRRRRRL